MPETNPDVTEKTAELEDNSDIKLVLKDAGETDQVPDRKQDQKPEGETDRTSDQTPSVDQPQNYPSERRKSDEKSDKKGHSSKHRYLYRGSLTEGEGSVQLTSLY